MIIDTRLIFLKCLTKAVLRNTKNKKNYKIIKLINISVI